MDKKTLYIGATIGGVAGGYIPVLFGADGLSAWSILLSTVGGVAGIYVAYKLTR